MKLVFPSTRRGWIGWMSPSSVVNFHGLGVPMHDWVVDCDTPHCGKGSIYVCDVIPT